MYEQINTPLRVDHGTAWEIPKSPANPSHGGAGLLQLQYTGQPDSRARRETCEGLADVSGILRNIEGLEFRFLVIRKHLFRAIRPC